MTVALLRDHRDWGIVQRQDPGFWYQLRGFESLYPSQTRPQAGVHARSGLFVFFSPYR